MDPLELLGYFESRNPESVALLRRLVDIESNSFDKRGVDKLAFFLMEEFRARGAEAQVLQEPTRGNLLEANWRGVRKPVLLLGHLDTVWPAGTLKTRPFRVANGKAYGPGIFDMKSGILLALLACEAFQKGYSDPGKGVNFLFTSDEEIGTEAGLPHLKSSAEKCAAVLCLEPPLPGGRAKTFRKGVSTYRVRVDGIASHAGVDHEAGANAIEEMSRHVLDLQAMTDYARGVTVSVGRVEGGSALNIVPALAEAEVDVRTASMADASWMDQRIRSLRVHDPRCGLHVEGGVNRPPLERTEGVAALYLRARAAAAELGMELGEGPTGGGSDGSFTAAMGIPTLDGLGVDGAGAHAANEYVEISDIPRRAALLCRLVQAIET